MAAPVFISYSSKDTKSARTICAALESRGLSCWISDRDVAPGENFMDAIVNALSAAKVMVLVFSENANNSDDIKREIAVASSSKIPVIPVRVEDVVPKGAFAYQLMTRQWIDLFDDWEAQIDRLGKRIADIVPATPSAKPPAALESSTADSAATSFDGHRQDDANEEPQKNKAASQAAAPSYKVALKPALAAVTVLGLIAVIGIALWWERPSSDSSAAASQTCYEDLVNGNYSAAIAVCGHAIALNPTDVYNYINRCGGYNASHNYRAALADCTQAITLDPTNKTAYGARCISNWGLGDYNAALADCNKAIALDPQHARFYDDRGLVYEKLSDNAKAIADYQKALTIDPSDQYAKDGLKRLGAS